MSPKYVECWFGHGYANRGQVPSIYDAFEPKQTGNFWLDAYVEELIADLTSDLISPEMLTIADAHRHCC